MDQTLAAIQEEIRQGFLLLAAAMLRCNGSSDNAMTVEGATGMAKRLADVLRPE